MLKIGYIETPIGEMCALFDEKGLYMLHFTDYPHLDKKIEQLSRSLAKRVVSGEGAPYTLLREELSLYFQGTLTTFKTPLSAVGTPFRKAVWNALSRIPFGKTCSYLDVANSLNRPTASRAVAGANGANPLSIIVPCHRVIYQDGQLGGYAGGVERKKHLLRYEGLDA